MASQRRARVAAGLAATALVLGIPGAQLASARDSQSAQLDHQSRTTAQHAIQRIAALRRETARWLRMTGATVAPAPARALQAAVSPARLVALWEERAAAARRRALHPPHLADWLCIHRYEGAWSARTGNGYYGGLQMDVDFQRTYGALLLRTKGTADNWSPLEQIWVAERARSSGRGFEPWPATSRLCGLR